MSQFQPPGYSVKPYRQAEAMRRVRTHLKLRALRMMLEEVVYMSAQYLRTSSQACGT